jgi:hypothetical protein
MATVPIRQPEEEAKRALDGGQREVTVRISVDEEGKISVQPDPFWVSKRGNQEVRWILEQGDGEFLVDFGDNSPFYESQFSQDSPVSGLARRDILPHEHRTYEYTVFVGDEKLDPGGGVRP